MIETEEFTMAESKDEAFWIQRRKDSENAIKQHELAMEEIPRYVSFHKALIALCDTKILKHDENTKP